MTSARTSAPAATRGFRPNARRRNRIAAGLALGAAAIGANLVVYASLDDTTTALQAVENIPAGSQVTADMFRIVDVDVDASVPTVSGDQLGSLIGQYAVVRMVAGQLVVDLTFQPDPTVSPGKAIVAIEVDADLVPVDVRERSPLQLVVVGPDDVPAAIPGTAAAPPAASASGTGTLSLAVEVDLAQAPTIATADVVRVVLLPPIVDDDSSDSTDSAGDPNVDGAVTDGDGG